MNWYSKLIREASPADLNAQARTSANEIVRRFQMWQKNPPTRNDPEEVMVVNLPTPDGKTTRIRITVKPSGGNAVQDNLNIDKLEYRFSLPTKGRAPDANSLARTIEDRLSKAFQPAQQEEPTGPTWHNQYDPTGEAKRRGDQAERDFTNTYQSRGAKRMEDIDTWFSDPQIKRVLDQPPYFTDDGIEIDGKKTWMQVKGQKFKNDKWLLVEFRNVSGRNGWLYPDFKALARDYGLMFDQRKIAFEQSTSFLVFDLDALRAWAEKSFDMTAITSDKEQAMSSKTPDGKRMIYFRGPDAVNPQGRPDERVGFVPVHELIKAVPHEVWPKAKANYQPAAERLVTRQAPAA